MSTVWTVCFMKSSIGVHLVPGARGEQGPGPT